MPGAEGGPLAARHEHVVVQPFDAVHHGLRRRLQAALLGQLCRYHGNDLLQRTVEVRGRRILAASLRTEGGGDDSETIGVE